MLCFGVAFVLKRHSARHHQKRRHSATVVDKAVGVLFKDNDGFWVVDHCPLKHSPGFAIVRTASAETGGLRHIEERQVTVPCLFGEQPCLSLCTMWSPQSKAANYTKLAAPARDNSCCVRERWLRGANGRAQQLRFGVGPNQDEADNDSFGSRRLVHTRELDRVLKSSHPRALRHPSMHGLPALALAHNVAQRIDRCSGHLRGG